MRFRMLGPLEITADDQSLALGGSKQRATLGFLLLRVNKVVATSQLLKALWPEDEAPNSARKILQNTVWGLRRVLAANGDNSSCDPSAPWVVTQQPGYMLRVSTDQIDLFRFRTQVEEGRARLAAGKPDLAAQQLKDALALWRGPVLADLVEGGVSWPELAAVQGARLDALEDYFEAELARGRHQAILGELETLVETEPLRERACGQLMLALYRCGRQADALSVYARVRAELVENLGLEPGHDLRLLHQAILNQDPELILPSSPMSAQQSLPMGWSAARPVALAGLSAATPVLAPAPAPTATAAPGTADRPRAEADPLIPAQTRGLPDRAASPAPPSGATAYGTGELAAPAADRAREAAERKWLGVLLIRTEPTPQALESPVDVVDRSLAETSAAVREEVERLNGSLAATIGSVSLALFGVRRSHGDDTARAVRAALAVRDRLAHTGLVEFRAAIDTGEVLVHFCPDDENTAPRVSGRLLDGAQTLLAGIPAGEIHASSGVHSATEAAFSYLPTDGPGTGWKLAGPRRDRPGLHTLPIVDREYELELLSGLVELAEHRAAPHLVTMVGADGVGKTRLVTELGRRVAGRPDLAQFLAATTPAPDAADAGPLAVPAELLRAYCGILPGDPPEKVRGKLARPLRELPPGAPSDADGERALSLLLPLVTPGDTGAGGERGAGGVARTAEVLDAWRSLLVRAARVRPVVIAVDDLHLADDLLLDCVERLPEAAGPVPLVVVAAARPELRERRPVWGAGAPHTTTLTLSPLSDTAVDRLLDLLVTEPTAGMDKRNGGMLHRTLQGAACHPPADRRRQVRELLRLATPLPELPAGAKSPEPLAG